MTVTEKQRNDSTKGKMMENNWTGKMWKDHPGSVQLGFYSQSLGRLFLFVVKNFARAKIFAAVTENICRVFHLLVHNFTVQFCSHHCKFCWCPAYKSATRSWTYRSERQRKTFILLQEFKQTKKSTALAGCLPPRSGRAAVPEHLLQKIMTPQWSWPLTSWI